VTDVDTTAADALDELITDLARAGIELHFAEMKGHVKDRLRSYGVYQRLGDASFHPTVGTAVKAYLVLHHVPWVDWEDAAAAGTEDAAERPEEADPSPEARRP
jgi:hypothetical protein